MIGRLAGDRGGGGVIERLVSAGEGWVVRIRCSERSDGDFRCLGATDGDGLDHGGRLDHGDGLDHGGRLDHGDGRDHGGRLDRGDGRDRGDGLDHGGRLDRGDGRDRGDGLDHGGRLARRRRALMDGPWTWLQQVHGAGVVVVTEPGGSAGSVADGAVTAVPRAVLALHTADCAPVVVVGPGAVGVAHAGWRGVVAGVLGEVVQALRTLTSGAGPAGLRAVVGPVIRPSAYEFGPAEMAAVAGAAGCDVAGVTSWGAPALDLAAAVRGALAAAGVSDVEDLGYDTASERFFSHRVRGEPARQATAVRLERRQEAERAGARSAAYGRGRGPSGPQVEANKSGNDTAATRLAVTHPRGLQEAERAGARSAAYGRGRPAAGAV